jgi:hypothetical protein
VSSQCDRDRPAVGYPGDFSNARFTDRFLDEKLLDFTSSKAEVLRGDIKNVTLDSHSCKGIRQDRSRTQNDMKIVVDALSKGGDE